MYNGYDYEWEFPYTDGFTGPYYSDGKFQASVAKSSYKVRSKLAAFSRQHDKDYNLCRTDACLRAADERYALSTAGMSFIPRTIGKIPLYVNQILRGGGRRKLRMGNVVAAKKATEADDKRKRLRRESESKFNQEQREREAQIEERDRRKEFQKETANRQTDVVPQGLMLEEVKTQPVTGTTSEPIPIPDSNQTCEVFHTPRETEEQFPNREYNPYAQKNNYAIFRAPLKLRRKRKRNKVYIY